MILTFKTFTVVRYIYISVYSRFPLGLDLLLGGVRSSRLWSTSSAITPVGSVHKSRGDNVVHMWLQLKR